MNKLILGHLTKFWFLCFFYKSSHYNLLFVVNFEHTLCPITVYRQSYKSVMFYIKRIGSTKVNESHF